MAYGGLALRALPHNAGHHVVWRRPWSAEDDTVVASHGQRLPRAASDEVALKLHEDHSHVRHRLAHRRAWSGRPIARLTPAYSLAVSGLLPTTARWISPVSRAMARVSSVLVSNSCSSTRKSWSAFCCWKVAWRF